MTYLIVAVAILGLTEVLTLTLLKRRNEDIRYYRSEDYKTTSSQNEHATIVKNGVMHMMQEIIDENSFLRDENRRLNNELTKHYFATVAKANLLDIIIEEGYILQSTLEKCINQLDEIDQLEIRKAMTNGDNQ